MTRCILKEVGDFFVQRGMRDRHYNIASPRKLAGNSSVPTSNKNPGIGKSFKYA
ncbi:hypothetical protein [Nodularia sp. NIES-3585]|uniref:hypothetical protein n=1 Tax=Nodularia sp. NIES-3585 TaxID=1973477 RepID=UPI0015960A95|nr:hypothetical protein [Nodularia sp. NIES-3585]